MSNWEDDIRAKIATDHAYARTHPCDDTKAGARAQIVGGLLEQYDEMFAKAEDYNWNETYVNVRVAALGDILEALEADDTLWEE